MTDRPDYIAGCAEPMDRIEEWTWLDLRAQEARDAGCLAFRASRHPDNRHEIILEAWKDKDAIQGDPHFPRTEIEND